MQIKTIFITGIASLLTFLILFSGCKNNNKETLLGSICDTTNTKFSTVINPIIVSKCLSCHNNSSASGGVNLEGYDNVKANYNGVLSTIKDGSMPKGSSSLDICTITKIDTWVNKGAQNN